MGKHVILLGISVLLNIFSVDAQEEGRSEKFAYRSFSFSPLGIYAGGNSGPAFSGDVSFDYGKNIFILEIGAGTEGNIIGNSDAFTELNLLYGRSFPLSEKIFTEVFAGAGYFHFNTYGVIDSETGKRGEIDKKTIGFPIGAKLQFKLGPRYSMGVKVGANINSVETVGMAGLILQWNRKRN